MFVLYIEHLCYNRDILFDIQYNGGWAMDIIELGLALADARKKHKLTQANLAKLAGIGRATLSQIECGTINEIGINKIIRLCELLSLELIITHKSTRPTLQQLLAENNHHD